MFGLAVTLRSKLWSVLFFLCISCLWPQWLWLSEAVPAMGGLYKKTRRPSPVLLRKKKKAWSKATPLKSLRFLIFENDIPIICCEVRGVGEGKGGSYMTVSEWFYSQAVTGTSQSCSTSLSMLLSPAPLPCTRHSCPAPTNPTLWGCEEVARLCMVRRVREMQLWLLGNMNRLWLSPCLHVRFESWRLLSHCSTGCSYSAFCIKSHAVTVQPFSGWCWMKRFVMCRLQHSAQSCWKCLPRYFLQLQWCCCSWF